MYRYDLSAFYTVCMDEAYDGNQREFIMSILLRRGQSVKRKSREAKNIKDLIKNNYGLMSND